MKGFQRSNQLLSLCGLNCALCTMRLGGYCPGCGGGAGNQPCKIAKCSLEHNNVEYCFQCEAYPCEKYTDFDLYDSFITHLNRKADMEKAQRIGIPAYTIEQEEKSCILQHLLSHYNDGRKKTSFSIAVNLLELEDLKNILAQTETHATANKMSPKEASAYIVQQLQTLALQKDISLKLRKKK